MNSCIPQGASRAADPFRHPVSWIAGARRRLQRWLAAVVLAIPAAALAAPGGAAISPADLSALLQRTNAPVLVDVRTPAEFHAGHIAGALNVAHDAIDENWRKTVRADPDDDVILYCGTGRRAGMAQQTLESMGWYHTRVLSGGIEAWTKAGLPVVKDDLAHDGGG